MTPTLPDPGILDLFLKAFMRVFSMAWTGLTPGALWVASMLTAACLLPYIALMVAGIQSALMEALKPLMKIFFVVWGISNLEFLTTVLAKWLSAISLFVGKPAALMVGLEPITVEKFMRPGLILYEGMNIVIPLVRYVDTFSLWQIPAIVAYWVLGIGPLMFCFAAAPLMIMVAIIEFNIIAVMSLFPLAFALFAGSQFIAQRAIAGIISSALRLSAVALVVSIILPLTLWLALPPTNGEPDMWSIMAAGVGAFFLGFMVIFAPRYATSAYGGQAAWTGAALVGLAAHAASGAIRGARSALRG